MFQKALKDVSEVSGAIRGLHSSMRFSGFKESFSGISKGFHGVSVGVSKRFRSFEGISGKFEEILGLSKEF